MKMLFRFTGLVVVGLIFWTSLGYLLDLPSFPVVLPVCMAGIFVFFTLGFLKNREEKKRFREYLSSLEQDQNVQKKLKNERIDPGDKTGRAGVKTYFREGNTGLNWTGASVHGAVPQRKKRRTFLPKNR